MAYEFKRLSDVEVVAEPVESANVLIEENGVIKRAPKTAVGGAGGDPDLVIGINNHIENATIDNVSIVSGSIEAVYDAFESGKFPVVEVQIVVPSRENSYVRTARKIPAHITFYGDALFIGFMSANMMSGLIDWTCSITCYNNALDEFYKAQITISD